MHSGSFGRDGPSEKSSLLPDRNYSATQQGFDVPGDGSTNNGEQPYNPEYIPEQPYDVQPRVYRTVNCDVCRSRINILRDGIRVVRCPVCTETAVIGQPPAGKKFVRCSCNSLITCDSSKRFARCRRETCKRLNIARAVNPGSPSARPVQRGTPRNGRSRAARHSERAVPDPDFGSYQAPSVTLAPTHRDPKATFKDCCKPNLLTEVSIYLFVMLLINIVIVVLVLLQLDERDQINPHVFWIDLLFPLMMIRIIYLLRRNVHANVNSPPTLMRV